MATVITIGQLLALCRNDHHANDGEDTQIGVGAADANAPHPATAALDNNNTKNDDNNGNIAPTVSECWSDIDYPTTAQPDADDTPQRPVDTNSSAAAFPAFANTLRSTSTTSSSDGDDEEDSDEEIGAMIYASSKTARARRAAAEAEPVQINNSNQSPSSYYEPRSEVRKRKSLSNISSNSKEMKSAPKKKRILKSFEQRMDDLRAYKEKHGHVNVKKSDDSSLYEFFSQVRRARKNPEKSTVALTDDRIEGLDALGFDWRGAPRQLPR